MAAPSPPCQLRKRPGQPPWRCCGSWIHFSSPRISVLNGISKMLGLLAAILGPGALDLLSRSVSKAFWAGPAPKGLLQKLASYKVHGGSCLLGGFWCFF